MAVSSNGDVSQSAATVVSMASLVSSVYVTLSGFVAFDSLSACFLQEATVTAAMTTSNAKITGSRYFFFMFQFSPLIRLEVEMLKTGKPMIYCKIIVVNNSWKEKDWRLTR